jgi:flavoprotein
VIGRRNGSGEGGRFASVSDNTTRGAGTITPYYVCFEDKNGGRVQQLKVIIMLQSCQLCGENFDCCSKASEEQRKKPRDKQKFSWLMSSGEDIKFDSR